MVIDCSVPKGDRRADKVVQEAVLAERRNSILKDTGVSMARDAYAALCEMTGFDLRTFSSNLEKLVDYVGERKEIGLDDVESVLARTKKDPIYELTNAVSDRNVERALFYLSSLLSDDIHPLQALATVANAVRRLLIVKSFVESPTGKAWHPDCSYNRFQSVVMPAIQEHDRQLTDQLEKWEEMLSGAAEDPKPAKARKRKKIRTDLQIARNPGNPYPIYQTFRKSERFTKQDLVDIIGDLADADGRMKSTRQDPRLVVEETIIKICLPGSRTGVSGN